MKKCVFAGVFDPFTNGHFDIVSRAAAVFDEVLIAVADNAAKNPVLKNEIRLALVEKAVLKIKNVKVKHCAGLLVDFCHENNINCIIKGVRNSGDFDYENEMFKANFCMGKIDTLFFPSRPELSFVSSTFVRELLKAGRDISAFVPAEIAEEVATKFSFFPKGLDGGIIKKI